jgi:hypothetical protein
MTTWSKAKIKYCLKMWENLSYVSGEFGIVKIIMKAKITENFLTSDENVPNNM